MNKTELTYRVIELDPPGDTDFDLESWLADLLVDYWMAEKHRNEVDEDKYAV